MTVLHSGSNEKYASGWEHVFAGRKKSVKGKTTAKAVAKGAKKKPAKKK